MAKIISYQVVPYLPPRLRCLQELALNLRWSWDPPAIELFRRLDPDLWEQTGHNPQRMLGSIDQRRLLELETDEAFLAHMDRVCASLDAYLKSPGWFAKAHREAAAMRIAYFSAEFGLTECIPNYAGGLGILAGDHLKAASDLGLPLVGVGLLYQTGYFRQYLNVDGWQQESYPINDFHNLPIQQVQREGFGQLKIEVEFPGRSVFAAVWRVQVGRIPLYLLDTNIADNSEQDRRITNTLYGGDREYRMQQELVLGIGGMRALTALGIRPTICHMNEGHSAFMALERARQLMEEMGLTYAEARQATAAGNVFTTHTPVPAGFDVFEPWLIERYFESYWNKLGIDRDRMLSLGRAVQHNGEPFNMAYLAARHSSYANGVSRLHAQVTRAMARRAWPDYPDHEVPIGHVTNGIHTRSWISLEMSDLLNRYLGPRWAEDPTDAHVWNHVDDIPDEELWRTHQRRRDRLVSWARKRLASQLRARGASQADLDAASSVLDPDALTIGFARRFATYKRATLLLRDVARLKRLLSDPDRPVQLMIAGKAHPHDDAGKDLIRQMIRFARDPDIRRRVVFLEDYDMSVARYLVEGVDVWLNTPRRPNEASGTSGMKVLANGGLNLSVLDGWWCEGYDRDTGWSIGNGEDYTDFDYQDRVESEALYTVLEREVVPLFYDRDSGDTPHGWIRKMKGSMRKLCPVFNTNRMVAEYAERFYLPAARRHARLVENGACRARALVQWRNRIHSAWSRVAIEEIEAEASSEIPVGAKLAVRAKVRLGGLPPEEVNVQIYFGPLDASQQIRDGRAISMAPRSAVDGVCTYTGQIDCSESGMGGFSVRAVPFHEDALIPYEEPSVIWG